MTKFGYASKDAKAERVDDGEKGDVWRRKAEGNGERQRETGN